MYSLNTVSFTSEERLPTDGRASFKEARQILEVTFEEEKILLKINSKFWLF